MKSILSLCFCLAIITNLRADDAPLPPRVAPMRMGLPEGFKATLFAGEPDVVQPIAMCFDHRGRLWVAECLSYPNWHKDPKAGTDRILIFEDTKGTGSFDKRTIFADKLANVTALEVGFGGVFVGATPHLLFIPDRNGDDVPDGPPEILLDGFDIKAGHTVMNSLTWGPDGWFYGCHGIQALIKVGKPGTPPEKRPAMDCGVWRYHPVRKEFEVVAHGTTNPWGLDFDDLGRMFITNCVIGHLWHVVPGAHFERMYGQDINPNIYGLLKTCADHRHWGTGAWQESRGGKGEHSDAGGGHAHVGCMIYLGDSFPQAYRGGVFMCNLHGNRINHDILESRGSGVVARHGKDFLFANDPWFRGLALCYGPDGGVYVSDWTDTGECHNYKAVDRTNGRIYKVSYDAGKRPVEHRLPDLGKLSDADLVKLQGHRNDWYVRMARRVLQERAAAGKLDKATIGGLRDAFGKNVELATRPEQQLRLLWAVHAVGALDADLFAKALESPHEAVRAWAVTLRLEQRPQQTPPEVKRLAAKDPSPVVRLALACALPRMPLKDRYEVALHLLSWHEDAADPYLPLLIWYGVESFAEEDPKAADYLLTWSRIPLVREYMARRRAARDDSALASLVALLLAHDVPAFQRDILRGMREALKGRRALPTPSGWKEAYPVLTRSPLPEVAEAALQLAVQFGDKRALAALEKVVVNHDEANAKRRAALETLLDQQNDDLVPLLQRLLTDAPLRNSAIKGLARFADVKTPGLLLKDYSGFSEEDKNAAVHTLTSRPEYAKELLEAVASGKVPRPDISAYEARQIEALADKEISEKLSEVWGALRPASQDKAVLMKKYKVALTPSFLKKADLARGHALFKKTCASCHRLFDEGGNIGPELTGSQRTNLDYLLENMLDPSAVVAKDYQVTVLHTFGGRVITGIVKQETAKAVTVQTPNELLVLPKEDIETRSPSRMSMMPEGQLDSLTLEEIRDLVGYLSKK